MSIMNDTHEFELYDLRVEVVEGPGPMVCNHAPGDSFTLRGENLEFPPGQTFPLYPLAALLPLLPAILDMTPPSKSVVPRLPVLVVDRSPCRTRTLRSRI